MRDWTNRVRSIGVLSFKRLIQEVNSTVGELISGPVHRDVLIAGRGDTT